MKFFICFGFILFQVLDACSQYYNVGDTLYIVDSRAITTTKFPNQPQATISIPIVGNRVILLSISEANLDSIDGLWGKWVLVRPIPVAMERYVFDPFISRYPVMPKAICTEPYKGYKDEALNGIMPDLLKEYVDYAFERTGEESFSRVESEGEGSNSVTSIQLKDSLMLFLHRGVHNNVVELELYDPRPSEIFYLIHHLLSFVPGTKFIWDEPKHFLSGEDDWNGCLVSIPEGYCVVRIERKANKRVSVFFINPI